MYNPVFRNLLFPLAEQYYGTTIQKNLKILEKTQWLSRNDLESIQIKKLRSLVHHAYSEVPYFHSIFRERNLYPDEIKTLADLQKIPVLTKETLKRQNNAIEATNFKKLSIHASSGGSSGEPVQFFRTKDDLSQAWAAAYRGWGWAGYNLGERYITLWGNPIGVAQQKKLFKRLKNKLTHNITLSAFDMTEENLAEYVKIIRHYNPKIIRGYAQAIFIFSQYLKKNNISDIHPKAILTTAETLFKHQRSFIESQFGCRVFDGYGGGEAPSAAYECEEHTGYHITSENIIIEFIKDNEVVSPGEKGKLVITNLNSYAMPFIRYDMEDIGILSDELCSCGRGLPLIKSIEGRVNDIIITPEGKMVHSYMFMSIFKDIRSVNQFQVIQEKKEKIVVNIIKNENFTEKDHEFIVSSIQHVLGNDLEICVKYVDDIPVLKGSGKRRFVISKVPLNM